MTPYLHWYTVFLEKVLHKSGENMQEKKKTTQQKDENLVQVSGDS